MSLTPAFLFLLPPGDEDLQGIHALLQGVRQAARPLNIMESSCSQLEMLVPLGGLAGGVMGAAGAVGGSTGTGAGNSSPMSFRGAGPAGGPTLSGREVSRNSSGGLAAGRSSGLVSDSYEGGWVTTESLHLPCGALLLPRWRGWWLTPQALAQSCIANTLPFLLFHAIPGQ